MTKKALIREKDIIRSVRDALKLSGWFIIRNQQNMGSHLGLSDLTIIKNGRVIFMEIKTDVGVQSDKQIKFEKDVATHGGEYRLVRSIDGIRDLLEGEIIW